MANNYRVVPQDNSESKYEFEKRRKELHITRKQMADMFEIPYKSIQNWESGATTIPKYVDRALAKMLDQNIREKRLNEILKTLNVAEVAARQDSLIEWFEELKTEIRKCI